jgi:hypothetical protein
VTRGTAIARAPQPRRAPSPKRARFGGSATAVTVVIAAAAAGLWLLSGVGASQMARYVAYQAVFIVGPGWLVYRWLRPRDGWGLRRLAFSWALGYALECAAFMLTAAVGLRSAFLAYPAVAAGVAIVGRRVSGEAEGRPAPRLPRGWPWALAAVCVVALAYVGLQYFGTSPLPGHVPSASYGLDSVWNLSLAAEAKHHWPITDPTASGTSLSYHLFATFDVAATSQVTGLSLPLVLFRLWPVPLVVLACLQLCVFGVTAGRRAWAGPIVAGLVLLGSELNVDPHLGYKFANELSDDIIAISPSFLLGLVFFLPALTVLYELAAERLARPRTMVLLGLLLFGCAGAKATILPVLVGGLALFVVWRGARGRGLHRSMLAALCLTGAAYALSDILIYNAAGGYGLALDPPGAVRQMPALGVFAHGVPGGLAVVGWGAAVTLGLAGAYWLFLLGTAVHAGRRDAAAPLGAGLLVCVALTGAAPFLLFTHYGFSQVFFVEYGLIAVAPLAADGLLWVWRELRSRAGPARLTVLGGVWLAGIAVAAFAVPGWLGVATARQSGLFSAVDLVLAGSAALVLGRLALRRRRVHAVWLYAAAALTVIALAAKPLTTVSPAVTRLGAGQPLYSQTGNGLTAGLYRGLRWVQDHTRPDDVIAVNNYRDGSLYWDTGWRTPDDYYYTALGERRTFLEGWVYAQRSFDIGEADVFAGRKVPFPWRHALNEAMFQRADRRAFAEVVRSWHVRYLFVDRVHNWATPWLGYLALPVYCSRDAVVYAVGYRPGRRGCVQPRRPRMKPGASLTAWVGPAPDAAAGSASARTGT